MKVKCQHPLFLSLGRAFRVKRGKTEEKQRENRGKTEGKQRENRGKTEKKRWKRWKRERK